MRRHKPLVAKVALRAKAKGSKYGNKRQTYGGYIYDSRAEAAVAMELDARKHAGEIVDWERQFRVEMWAHDRHGTPRLKLTHKVDFRLHHHDGTYELLEVKGLATADYRMRRRWLEKLWLPEHPDHRYTVRKV